MNPAAAISVLLPVFNSAHTLGECLDSIGAQTWTDFEVIVVDDGSNDETQQILRRYAAQDPRIKPYWQAHKGIVAALNYGLTRCQGAYIARMDADDRMHCERLTKQYEFAKQHPEVDLIGAQFNLFREQATLSPAQLRYQHWSNSLLSDEQLKQNLFLEAVIAHPTFFAHKAVFDQLGAYRDHIWAEDYDFLMRAWAKGLKFAKIAQILLEKRDSETRLYRTDARCKRPAMLQAKAHYFSQNHCHWLGLGDKSLVIAGAGSSARMLGKALRQEGIVPHLLIDDKKSSQKQRTIANIEVCYRYSAQVKHILSRVENYFIILCIGNKQGREEQMLQLQNAGWSIGQHYLRFL